MSNRYSYSTSNILRRALEKENSIRSELKKQKVVNNLLADLLAHKGELEESVSKALEGDDAEVDKFTSFLDEQRERVKGWASKHTEAHRYTDAFMIALKEVQDGNNTIPGADDDGEAPTDYEVVLQTKTELIQQKLEQDAVPSEEDPYMQEVKEKLREQTSNANIDDDIEIEISNTESSNEYTGPITQALMKIPMRNKVCGHVYDKQGIMSHLRSKRTCPIPGCRNQSMNMGQLELDEELQMKIRRYGKKLERERLARLSQSEDVDDLDLDNDGGAGTNQNFTVLE